MLSQAAAQQTQEDGKPSMCSLHSQDVQEILQRPEMALELAVAAAAGGSNRIQVEQFQGAVTCQRQSALWLDIHERASAVKEMADQKALWEAKVGKETADKETKGDADDPSHSQDAADFMLNAEGEASSGREPAPVG